MIEIYSIIVTDRKITIWCDSVINPFYEAVTKDFELIKNLNSTDYVIRDNAQLQAAKYVLEQNNVRYTKLIIS